MSRNFVIGIEGRTDQYKMIYMIAKLCHLNGCPPSIGISHKGEVCILWELLYGLHCLFNRVFISDGYEDIPIGDNFGLNAFLFQATEKGSIEALPLSFALIPCIRRVFMHLPLAYLPTDCLPKKV